MLIVGSLAPDFTLPVDGGSSLSLSSLYGQKVVLYFYPKDDTSGCTAEACAFRDAFADFTANGSVIFGISRDSVERHDKFKVKYSLPFRLGADEAGEVCSLYGVWVEKSMYGRKYMGIERSSFLIDSRGIIRAIWRKVKLSGHVSEVMAALLSLDRM